MLQLVGRACFIAALGLAISWLLLFGNSPLADWLTEAPSITNVVAAVNLPTVLFALANFPGSSAPVDGVVALVGVAQWLVYGFAIAWVWRRLWPNRSLKSNSPRQAA